jgi:ABC-2 type transport system ATP-binding protein
MNQAVAVSNISKHYGHVEALSDLSVTIEAGEIFGLLGANGAGKTTLIKILVGALDADSGSVSVLGLHPQRQKHELRRLTGYMPQQPALYEDLTARDNVRFFARAQPISRLEQRIDEVLEFLDLGNRADDPVYKFSGGMKQRVSLACALVHQPKLLLLDEPSTGVDPKLREALWAHFRALTQEGVTIVLSTHQMDEALHCHRVAVMRNGSLLASDTPRNLLARGQAKVVIWKEHESHTYEFDNYRVELPQALGIQDRVKKIEIQEETLEDVVLRMIAEKEPDRA